MATGLAAWEANPLSTFLNEDLLPPPASQSVLLRVGDIKSKTGPFALDARKQYAAIESLPSTHRASEGSTAATPAWPVNEKVTHA